MLFFLLHLFLFLRNVHFTVALVRSSVSFLFFGVQIEREPCRRRHAYWLTDLNIHYYYYSLLFILRLAAELQPKSNNHEQQTHTKPDGLSDRQTANEAILCKDEAEKKSERTNSKQPNEQAQKNSCFHFCSIDLKKKRVSRLNAICNFQMNCSIHYHHSK